MSEEVVLDPASEDKLTSKIADKLKGLVAKREAVEAKEEEKLSGIADFIDQEITKRVDEKLAEKTTVKEEEAPAEKKEEKQAVEKTPEQRVKELEAELAALKKPPEQKPAEAKPGIREATATVTPVTEIPGKPSTIHLSELDVEDMPQEVQDAIAEVSKNEIPGFATIFEYMFSKKKKSGDQL